MRENHNPEHDGTCHAPDTHRDSRGVSHFRPVSKAEQDADEMRGYLDGNRTYWSPLMNEESDEKREERRRNRK